jgi:hypothetical protein
MKKTFLLTILSFSFNIFSQNIPNRCINEFLIEKIIEGNNLKVNVLLYNGADAKYIKNNKPAIYYAIDSRNINIVSNLIDYGANVCLEYNNQDILTYTYNTYKTYDPSDQFNIRPTEEEVYKIIKYHYENCSEENSKSKYNGIKKSKPQQYKGMLYAPYQITKKEKNWIDNCNKIKAENNPKKEDSWVTRQNEILGKYY